MSQGDDDAHQGEGEQTKKEKKKENKVRRLKTRRFAEEGEEDGLSVHPSGIHMRQKMRAAKTKVCVCVCCCQYAMQSIGVIIKMMMMMMVGGCCTEGRTEIHW